MRSRTTTHVSDDDSPVPPKITHDDDDTRDDTRSARRKAETSPTGSRIRGGIAETGTPGGTPGGKRRADHSWDEEFRIQNEKRMANNQRIQEKFRNQEGLISRQTRDIQDLKTNTQNLTQEIEGLKSLLQGYNKSLSKVVRAMKEMRGGANTGESVVAEARAADVLPRGHHAPQEGSGIIFVNHPEPHLQPHQQHQQHQQMQHQETDPSVCGRATLVTSASSADSLVQG
jgi:hypothetical protein